MRADTPEPLHYTESPENGFYNLKDSPMIINLSSYLYIDTSFADSKLTRKWNQRPIAYYISTLIPQQKLVLLPCTLVAAQGQQGPADLVLGSPLNPMVPHTIQTFLSTETWGIFLFLD